MGLKPMLLLMNPCAGTQLGRQHLADIIALFCQRGWAPLTFVPAEPGDSVRLAAQYGPQMELVVCIGGDGTLNEVITGLLQAGCRTPIGYIPAGSTNDFASSLRLPRDLLEAARNIVDGTPHPLDVGRFENRYFSYVASFGLFTRASYATPQHMKNLLGHFAYVLEGMRDLSDIRSQHLRIESETRTVEGDYLFGAICNSTSVGGIIKLDPERVDLSDGLFEIFLVKQPASFAEVNECIWSLNNRQYDCTMVEFFSASNVTVQMPDGIDWTLDGEYERGGETVHIQNLHNAFVLVTRDNA